MRNKRLRSQDWSYFDSLYVFALCPSTDWILSIDCTSASQQANGSYSMTACPDFHRGRPRAGRGDPSRTILCQQCWKEVSDLKSHSKGEPSYLPFSQVIQDAGPRSAPQRACINFLKVCLFWHLSSIPFMALTTTLWQAWLSSGVVVT